MIALPKVVFAPKWRWPSPLSTRLIVSRTALDLAGGRTALLELFASRLRAFSREQGYHCDVGSDDDSTWRRTILGEGPQQYLRLYAPRDIKPPVNVEAELETYDTLREIFPSQQEPDFVPDDPLLALHNTLVALMRGWPEMARRMGTVPRRRRD